MTRGASDGDVNADGGCLTNFCDVVAKWGSGELECKYEVEKK